MNSRARRLRTHQRRVCAYLILSLLLFILLQIRNTDGALPVGASNLTTENEIRPRLQADQDEGIELIGHIGGPTLDVTVSGHYAYVGEGVRLTILDISDPTQPALVGKSDLFPWRIRSVAITGDYVYLAHPDGLRIVDVSDPTTPVEVAYSDVPESPLDILVSNGYAYVADSYGLRVMDISNPVEPVEVGLYDPPGRGEDVFLVGSYAYLVTDDLRIVDVSDPTVPTEVGVYSTECNADAVFVTGNYVYIADNYSGTGCGLRIVDMSDPTTPVEVSFYYTNRARDVYVANNYAYVTTAYDQTLKVLDISDPVNLTEVGSYRTLGIAGKVKVIGGYAYISDRAGLRIVDVSDPTHPTEVGFYDTFGYASDIFVAGNYAYVADGRYGGLRVLDISNPEMPQIIGRYDTPGSAVDVYVKDGYAYIADAPVWTCCYWVARGSLRIVDVSDPTTPVEVSAYDLSGDAQGVSVVGDYAYVADGLSGLRILNISDLTAPVEVGFYDTAGWAADVFVTGDYAYVADGHNSVRYEDSGFRVLNVADVTSPFEVGFYDTPASPVNVQVRGNYAYIADADTIYIRAEDAGLRVMDISDPTSPTEISFYQIPIVALSVVGDYAYVAAGGLRIIDISNPTSPTEVGFYDTAGSSDSFVAGDYVYMPGAGSGGLAILQIPGSLARTYNIFGRVTDETGAPLPNATINVTGLTNTSTATESDGTYKVSDLSVGVYSVNTSKTGYLFSPTSHTITVPPDHTGLDFTGTPTTNVIADATNSSVAVSPDSVTADGTTEIQITVTLRDSDNNPVSGKVVQVLSSRGGQDTITQPATPTNTAGQTTATIHSGTAGTAELTVLDLTDNVELAQKPTVTFALYTPLRGDFIESVNRLTDTTTQQLNNLDNTTKGIANEGTYFRLAIGQHLAEGVVNAAFGLMDIFGGLAQLNQADEALKLSRPGLLDGGWERLFFEQDPYIYKERLLQASLYDAMRAGRLRGVAGALAWGGPDFFAAHVRNSAIDQMAEGAVRQAGQDIFARYPDGMLTIAYPSVQESVQQANQLLENQRSALLNNPPPLTRTEQDAYAYDLGRRQLVPFVLVQQASRQYQTLEHVHQVHLIGSMSEAGELLLRLGGNLLATGFFDGPGKILVGGGLGAFDTYMASQKLDEAGQMYGLAVGAMNSVPLKLNQIPLNAVKGLGQIRLRETPDTVTGRIDAVVNRSRGNDRILGLGWAEEAAYSDITITNTSNSSDPAVFYVTSSYLIDPGFLPASQFLYEEQTITLAPGDTGTVRIYYKNGNRGVSPVPGSALTIEVLGANATGIFFVDSFGDRWEPTREASLAAATATLSATTGTTPTIDDPLVSFVLSSPVTQQYEGQLWINNPFTDTITADVTQPLPTGATPIDLNGGTLDGSAISWTRGVAAEASEPISYTFEFSGTLGGLNNMPAATLSTTSPLDGQTYTVDSNSPEFKTLWPVTLERATPPSAIPGIDTTLPVTVTNLLDTAVTGSVQIEVTDTTDTVVHTETQNFDVAGGDQQTLSFTLPSTLAKGYYAIECTLTAGGASTTAFIDTIQVGLPSPTLSYRVEPEDLVHPTETLTYTLQVSNTTGVTLNNTVLTTTIPVSTTMVQGSITGGGAIAGNEVQWDAGSLVGDQALSLSYQVTVNEDAVGTGVQTGRLESTSSIAADEIQPAPGPTLWNLVSLCGIIQGDVNCSCKVDSQDAQLLSAHWGEGVNDPNFEQMLDLDENFETNVIDVMKAVVHWNETCPFGIGP